MDLSQLRTEADTSARFRGHIIDWVTPWHGEGRSLQNGSCRGCGMEVQINSKPLPNQIDIGGEAVALNCCV